MSTTDAVFAAMLADTMVPVGDCAARIDEMNSGASAASVFESLMNRSICRVRKPSHGINHSRTTRWILSALLPTLVAAAEAISCASDGDDVTRALRIVPETLAKRRE